MTTHTPDHILQPDPYGFDILSSLQDARRFNRWMGDTLRPYLGQRVLEIGAGLGTLTDQFAPRERYLASDINPSYLQQLHAYAADKPYMRVARVDATKAEDFAGLHGQFDTAVMVNVLEHVPDEQATLRNLWNVLEPGGRAVMLVPQHPAIYGTLDTVLEHRERYTAAGLRRSLEQADFHVGRIFNFNRFAVPAWILNGMLLRKTEFESGQVKLLETIMPLVRRLHWVWPWGGLSIIGVGVKTGQ